MFSCSLELIKLSVSCSIDPGFNPLCAVALLFLDSLPKRDPLAIELVNTRVLESEFFDEYWLQACKIERRVVGEAGWAQSSRSTE